MASGGSTGSSVVKENKSKAGEFVKNISKLIMHLNVMPDYHRYGLRWGRWGFAFLKITIPHLLGKHRWYNPPHNPGVSPSSKTWD